MTNTKMHNDEIDINDSLVHSLLSTQFSHWAHLPISQIKPHGTDNAIYRLGSDMCVRLPRITWAKDDVAKEQEWLPRLAPFLPLAIPTLLGHGLPQEGYPSHWSIYSWIKGTNISDTYDVDLSQVAIDLAKFLIALQKIEINGPQSRRGLSLKTQDGEVRKAIPMLGDVIDTHKAVTLWEQCLSLPLFDKHPVWLHGDLLPGNLLIHEKKLNAIIDWGLSGTGDPACDLIPAWSIFDSKSRQIFREKLLVDDNTWMRGKGWVLSIALIIIPYYQNTNPELVAVAKRILKEIL